ncbi:MAG: hypothetical protein JWO04_2892 [Gammaproteobacteria bacterium]|nr:hypothetical protein [Gammaproteobacteria bacterium]
MLDDLDQPLVIRSPLFIDPMKAAGLSQRVARVSLDDTHPGLVEREGRGVLNRAPTYATWCDGFRRE